MQGTTEQRDDDYSHTSSPDSSSRSGVHARGTLPLLHTRCAAVCSIACGEDKDDDECDGVNDGDDSIGAASRVASTFDTMAVPAEVCTVDSIK